MKILLINNCHFRRGGADVVYLDTGRLLQDKGHEVIYFSISDEKNENSEYSRYFVKNPNFKNISFIKKSFSFLRYFYSHEVYSKLVNLINEFKPDIAHIHLIYGGGLTSAVVKALNDTKIPSIMTLHDYKLICPTLICIDSNLDLCNDCSTGNYFNCIKKQCNQITISVQKNIFNSTIFAFESYFRKFLFDPVKRVNKFLFVSSFSMDLHSKYLTAVKAKSVLLPNICDVQDNKSDSHSNYYLYMGRLSIEKGLSYLISAFQDFPQLELIIAGTGNEMNNIKENIEKNGIKNIKLAGFLSGSKKNEMIKNCKYVILNSICYENNPLSIIEAFSYGKPVIAPAIGGIPELVRDNKNGLLFKPRDLENLKKIIYKSSTLSNEDYSLMINNSFNSLQDFSNKESYYKSLISIYESIIN